MPLAKSEWISHILYTQYGPLIGDTGSLLLSRGSLPLSALRRLSPLSPTALNAALAIMATHDLISFSEEEVAEKLDERVVLNPAACLARTRVEDWIKRLDDCYPLGEYDDLEKEIREEVVRALWEEGKATPGVVAQRAAERYQANHADADVDYVASLAMSAFHALFQPSLPALSLATPGSMQSLSLLTLKWSTELRLAGPAVQTAKDVQKMKARLKERADEWRAEEGERARGDGVPDEEECYHGDATDAAGAGSRKRRRTGAGGRRKRARRGDSASSHSLGSGSEVSSDSEDDADPKLLSVPLPLQRTYRLAPSFFSLLQRSQALTTHLATHHGPAAAAVGERILALVTREEEGIGAEQSRSVSVWQIVDACLGSRSKTSREPIPDELLEGAFAPPAKKARGKAPMPPTDAKEVVKEICRVLAREDDVSILGREGAFLVKDEVKSTGNQEWYYVPWYSVSFSCRKALVEDFVGATYGKEALRCWKILYARGKLEEKSLAKYAFLSVKDTRAIITRLSTAGMIETQEVPRSTGDRAPMAGGQGGGRTFYLLYVDFDAVVSSLERTHYRRLSNLEARKAAELEKKKELVLKRSRSDVKENEELLSWRERETWKELEGVLEAIRVQQERCEKDLFVLRELCRRGWDEED